MEVALPAYRDSYCDMSADDRAIAASSVTESMAREALILESLASSKAKLGNWGEALELYRLALKKDPACEPALANRCIALRHLARYAEALECCNEVLKRWPENAAGHSNRGTVLRDLERYEEALADYDRSLALHPRHVNALKGRALTLIEMKRWTEALACACEALKVDHRDPQIWRIRGNAEYRLDLHEQAISSYDQALGLRPADPSAHYNRSLPLRELLRLDEAIASCQHAIQFKKDYAEAWWNMGEMLVLKGDYAAGWPMFEWRWQSAAYGKTLRSLPKPVWHGTEDLKGKSLLVILDGGFGDTIQFVRCALLLKDRTARVIVEVQRSLVPLLEYSFPRLDVIANGDPLPEFDYYCPMMSLLGALRLKLQHLPAANLPYLRVPSERMAYWENRLGGNARKRVGIVCSGSREHSRDGQRSIPLLLMTALLKCDADFHLLQKELRDTDRDALSKLPIQCWHTELQDFADTAALTRQMDLVISADTSVAHLAASVGTPTWILLPFVPDMRWLLDRSDSPWYPDLVRLFRQSASRDWGEVLVTVRQELASFLSELACIEEPAVMPEP